MMLAGLALAGFAAPAVAHHSFSMFDADKTAELVGAVKEFQWTNPHAWLQVVVADGKGGTVEWSIEMAAPNILSRQGWKPKSLAPGDAVTVVIHPLKSGSTGGALLSVSLPNGQKLGQDNSAAARETAAP
jgi:hypothetical protein